MLWQKLVVINFFQFIFIFPLFLGMVMYANEFKTKEKQKLTEIKKINCNMYIYIHVGVLFCPIHRIRSTLFIVNKIITVGINTGEAVHKIS